VALSHFTRCLEALAGLWLPRRCLLCGRQPLRSVETTLCSGCGHGLPVPMEALCPRCGSPRPPGLDSAPTCAACHARPPHVQTLRAPYFYEAVLRDLIQTFKFRPEPGLARLLGTLFVQGLEAHPFPGPPDCVVPVPLHPKRKRGRGFNQSELLARPVARALGVALETRILARRRDTDSQVGKGMRARRRNVRGAFQCRRTGRPVGLQVLLIDDVVTTGSTVSEAARALRGGGARGVWVGALARAGPTFPA